ncbi:polysaccharide biosynthesis tyrosine autokinase [Methylobacterium sp. Leaf111]|uniref:polysaccharide biosynthesis tyrosine autokinase n=1 Tax=Methylobacterium sp. Leaf111 TaxID=1736257 RepID=UPI0012E8F1F2|nr:polysaccharide biosynthesis tyrosine autokinase [Methylobacterium sp. Leaf111]
MHANQAYANIFGVFGFASAMVKVINFGSATIQPQAGVPSKMLMTSRDHKGDIIDLRQSEGPLHDVAPPLTSLIDILRRHWTTIVLIALFTTFVSAAYLLTADRKYTASASILIDSRKSQLFQNQQIVGDVIVDTGMVESQAEILRSETIALSVIRALNLATDPEFTDPGIFGWLTKLLGFGGDVTEFGRERAATAYLTKNLVVKRTGATYAIEIDFTSTSPTRAAQVANQVADAYMVGELEAKFQATKRASEWLQARIGELRDQAAIADRAVQNFRAQNNIIDTGRGLITDQQISEVNTQLTTARSATAEALARLDRVEAIFNQNVPDASITDALRSDVISRLRAQYLDLATREADYSKRFGTEHGSTVQLRSQMNGIRKAIADEVRRIAQAYRSDYEIARSREAALDKRMEELRSTSTLTSQAQVKLRDLESTSQSARNLYDNFLQRSMEAAQQQTSPVNEARIITAATPPTRPSWPKGLIVLGAGLTMGLLFGSSIAVAREVLDDTLRSPSDVERATGLKCLGVVPRVDQLPASDGTQANPSLRVTSSTLGMFHLVVRTPFSRFTECIRWIKVSADAARRTDAGSVIGIVSALPNEGKTTIAANLAQLVAHAGKKVVIIDADLRHPSLTLNTIVEPSLGLREILSGHSKVSDVVWTDAITGLAIIPALMRDKEARDAELIDPQAFAALLSDLRKQYDYIIVDLPPIASVVDVKALGHLVDSFVLVIEWGRTSVKAVEGAISSVDSIISKGIGVVLNKADPIQLRRFEIHKGPRFNSYYE